jgi:hypothetical protein
LCTHGNVIALDIAAEFFTNYPRQVVMAIDDRRVLQNGFCAIERRIVLLGANPLPHRQAATDQHENSHLECFQCFPRRRISWPQSTS